MPWLILTGLFAVLLNPGSSARVRLLGTESSSGYLYGYDSAVLHDDTEIFVNGQPISVFETPMVKAGALTFLVETLAPVGELDLAVRGESIVQWRVSRQRPATTFESTAPVSFSKGVYWVYANDLLVGTLVLN